MGTEALRELIKQQRMIAVAKWFVGIFYPLNSCQLLRGNFYQQTRCRIVSSQYPKISMAIQSISDIINLQKGRIENLSITDLNEERKNDPQILLLDIREIQERIELGTIPGSTHVPRGMLEFWADPNSPYYRNYFEEKRRIVIFCAAGGRSVLATHTMQEMGFSNVANLEDGFKGWQESDQEIEDIATKSKWVRRELNVN